MISRREFRALAHGLKSVLEWMPGKKVRKKNVFRVCVGLISGVCQVSNPKFDPERFEEAIYGKKKVAKPRPARYHSK